jgi:hypothetical protein
MIVGVKRPQHQLEISACRHASTGKVPGPGRLAGHHQGVAGPGAGMRAATGIIALVERAGQHSIGIGRVSGADERDRKVAERGAGVVEDFQNSPRIDEGKTSQCREVQSDTTVQGRRHQSGRRVSDDIHFRVDDVGMSARGSGGDGAEYRAAKRRKPFPGAECLTARLLLDAHPTQYIDWSYRGQVALKGRARQPVAGLRLAAQKQ